MRRMGAGQKERTGMNDRETFIIANAAETAIVDFIKALLTATDSPTGPNAGPAYNSTVLTGCLYGVIRVMVGFRGPALEPEKFRSMMLVSVNSALSQNLPAAEPLSADNEAAFLNLMADTASRAVETLAEDLHERGNGPVCPMDGIVIGLAKGAAIVAGQNRDRSQYPHPLPIVDLIVPAMRDALQDLATVEAADAMGEAQGRG